METVLIEATQSVNGNRRANWGKFLVGRFDDREWKHESRLGSVMGWSLLKQCGWWSPDTLVILDLQTGEGIIVRPRGDAQAELQKHPVRVCPLFGYFLAWLYAQDLTDLGKLPAVAELPDAPFRRDSYRLAGG